MNETLFIIGNGFDLFHGIKSKYSDFKEYMSYYDKSFVMSMETYIDVKDLWSDFETALGKPNNVYELRDGYKKSIISQYNENNTKINNTYDYFISGNGYISDYMCNWIRSLKIDNIERKLKILSPLSHYLSFNYTNTLEQIYSISQEHILYIHGKAIEKSKLVFGHRNLDLFDTIKSNEFYDDDDNDNTDFYDEPTTFDEEASLLHSYSSNIIQSYFESTFKDVYSIININNDYFKNLSDVHSIYILGHSLSEIDLPYFRKIKKSVNKRCEWKVSYFGSKERSAHKKKLRSLGIQSSSIELLSLQQMCDSF